MFIKLIAKRTVIGIFVIICLSLPSLFSQVQQEKISKVIKSGEPKSQFAVHSSMSYSASYEGTHGLERVGYWLSGIGDVNGDEYDDFAIGNFHTNLTPGLPDKGNAGSVYLLLGKSSGFQMDVDLENADAQFIGKNANDAVGVDIGNQGDVNGDGYDDILIGAPAGSVPGNPGHAFLVLGNASANWGNDFTLEDQADASFDGEVNAYLTGQSVDIIGDLNDDGYDEFIIGAPLVDDEDTNRGKAYLFRGKAQGWQRHISVDEADAIFYGDVEGQRAGYSTKGVGDVNGDGIPDFAIGNRAAYGVNDRVFLLFGRSSLDWGTHFDLGDADVIFTGVDPYDGWAGWKIAPAGDVNGDGYDDILIGDPYCSSSQGKVFLIFGKSSGWSSISLNQADVVYQGSAAEQAGSGLGGNLDCNNDGLSDFLIGAPGNSRNGTEAGETYLVKGKRDGWQSIVNLNETYDYFRGEGEDQGVGYAVSGAGDFNHDGADDFVVSAPWNDDAGWVDYGKIYLFLGTKEFESVSGSVNYFSGSPVSNVAIRVNGDPVTTTDASALYSVRLQMGTDNIVNPFKTAGEDFDQVTISSHDASLIARNVVGLDELTSLQRRASDVDGDGTVLMYDAVQVARYAVGLTDVGGDRIGHWLFDPQNRIYQNISGLQENQDFTSMLVGDVDGGWNGTPSMSKGGNIQPITDLWENDCFVVGDTLTLLFSVTGRIPLLSFDIALTFEDEVLNFAGVAKNNIGKSFHIFSSADPGSVRLGGFCIDPVVDEGELVSLKFGISKSSNGTGRITLRRFQLNREVMDEALILWESGSHDNQSVAFRLEKNYPNPFNPFTTINYRLSIFNEVELSIFNTRGQKVRTLVNENKPAGHYSVVWDGKDDYGKNVSSGLYFYKLQAGAFGAIQKMILFR